MFELTPFDRKRHFSRYDPFRDFFDFNRRFFESGMDFGFKTDVREEGNAYVLEAELPGFKKEEIHADIDGHLLTIRAEHTEQSDKNDPQDHYIRRERYYGSFRRSFDLSDIKIEEISAHYRNGVLTLTMPKKDSALPSAKQIEIQ